MANLVNQQIPVPDGINADRVSAWLTDNIDGTVQPFSFALIAGGRSNLTYKVTDANGTQYVLRRPPLGHVLATAHDMGREFKIISGIGKSNVPVASALGMCTDLEVNGAPFYVMGYVEGFVLATLPDTANFSPLQMRAAGESLIDVLADLHALNPDDLGLGDLGKKEDYCLRQLKRWRMQWDNSKSREIPSIEETHSILSDHIPVQRYTGIVHGDYRLGNAMVGGDGRLKAVLDWELCTLGDTMADLGYVLMFWTEPGEFNAGRNNEPTLAEGYITKAEAIARYGERTGHDVSSIDFYVSLAYWRLACIAEGVYARYRLGAMGTGQKFDYDGYGHGVVLLADAALEVAQRLG